MSGRRKGTQPRAQLEVRDCTFHTVGIQHTPETRAAIVSVAEALRENAVALGRLAQAIAPSDIEQCGLRLDNGGKP